MKLSREIKTAFLVIGGILLFVFGFSFLKGKSFFEKDKIIYTVYDEVEGLVEGAKVTINGLVIGKIMKIDFLPNTTRILITMSVRNELDFSPQSEAILYEAGLIGGLNGASADVCPTRVIPGTHLSGRRPKPDERSWHDRTPVRALTHGSPGLEPA